MKHKIWQKPKNKRAMEGSSLRDKIYSTEIRRRSEVKDIIERVIIKIINQLLKSSAAHKSPLFSSIPFCPVLSGHYLNEWTIRIVIWLSWISKRSAGRSKKRCLDDDKEIPGRDWHQTGQDKDMWKIMEEAYIQEWMSKGWRRRKWKTFHFSLTIFETMFIQFDSVWPDQL